MTKKLLRMLLVILLSIIIGLITGKMVEWLGYPEGSWQQFFVPGLVSFVVAIYLGIQNNKQ